jgi:pre-mRNA-processing factor 39
MAPFHVRPFFYPGSNLVCAQLEDPDNFENWEKLVRATETLEGGLNRNSSPQAIATTRDSYDRFLAKFPLLFGYWKKYADLEFSIAGTEAAEMVS